VAGDGDEGRIYENVVGAMTVKPRNFLLERQLGKEDDLRDLGSKAHAAEFIAGHAGSKNNHRPHRRD